ncbi:hypothetical protein HY085_03295, partial [Candidatus Gottesmanbacteria bacterium]|nr:hypothetical protein [Candidatus Gottesmanbacteria bacterium]
RFYFSFIFPNNSLVKSHSYEALFAQNKERLIQLIAKSYEDASSEFVQEAINQKIFPGFEKMGRWWDKNLEIDLVGLNEKDNAILFVETKWNAKPLGLKVLEDLKNKTKKVMWGKENRKEHFALVAKGGFNRELVEKSKKEGVTLIKEDKIC